ncbi:MAG TPA: dTDP-4-dehydrorhamnose reductase [Paenirhodobacter sp.]
MKILIFGTTGQVATEIARRAGDDVALTMLSRADADLSDPAACAAAVTAADCDAVINAAAWTAVDRAETEETAAALVNGAAPAAIARAAAERCVPFVHISTDYVFAGDGTAPWKPGDPTGPLGAYGRSKLLGEEGVRAVGGQAAILRTSWVFSAHGANFVKTMLRAGATRDRLTVVADQIGGPTPAAGIADAVLEMARQMAADPAKGGTHHYAGSPDTSWAGFAREIFAKAGLVVSVEDIPSSAYPTPAVRPENSRMDCNSLAVMFAIPRPDWRRALDEVLAELAATA